MHVDSLLQKLQSQEKLTGKKENHLAQNRLDHHSGLCGVPLPPSSTVGGGIRKASEDGTPTSPTFAGLVFRETQIEHKSVRY